LAKVAKTAMSDVGQTRWFRDVGDIDISGPGRHFAFVPEADIPMLLMGRMILSGQHPAHLNS
jgi:hypothetical protein